MDTRRVLLNARNHWYPIVLQLQRFMVAVSRVAINHDGRSGSAPDPLVWDQGSERKQRKTDIGVNVDLASFPGPLSFLNRPWVQVGGCITGADVAAWPHGVSMLRKFTVYLGTLHWPAGASLPEVMILLEQRARHRLFSEKVARPHVRAIRPISISSVPVSEGIEVRQGCQFISRHG